ncbi:MAG: hypothetical protein IT440_11035, partial [Phycisphaeraceae bacterium]|nr:hypothetical protein [Phycisphaeraceae bacterium]
VDVQGNPATRVDRIWVDLAAPTAAWTSPTAGWATSNRPLARLSYADAAPGSGVDPAEGVQIQLDGADVTAESLRGEEFATHQTPIGSELTEGTHVYSATIQDRAGRSVTAVRTFAVDSISPLVTIASPTDGSSGAAYILDYRVLASDTNGVVLVSATINDHDVTAHFTTEPDGFLWHPVTGDPVFLQLGESVFRVTVADPAGNVAEREARFTVTAGPGGDPPPVVGPQFVLTIEDGDHQEGAIGRCVEGPPVEGSMQAQPGRPLIVRLVDANAGNTPAGGVPLLFEPLDPSGFVIEAPGYSTNTNAVGLAGVRCILGRTAGEQTVRVSVLGDAAVRPVTFTETGFLPEFTAEMPYRGEPNILIGSGEAWVRARLTRASLSGGTVRVDGTVRIEVLDAVGTPLGDEPAGLFVNPRSRPTNPYGLASFDVIPDEVRTWGIRVTAPDFPEVGERTFTVPAVPVAPRPMVLPMLSSTPLGQITTHDHEIGIHIDMSPMRIIAEGTREIFHVTVVSEFDEQGNSIYEFAPVDKSVWTERGYDHSQPYIPVFGVYVRPTAATVAVRPTPVLVILNYLLLDAETSVVLYGAQRHERLAVGAPEVRLVREDPTNPGTYVRPQFVTGYDPLDFLETGATPSPSVICKYYIEARLPRDEPENTTGDLVARDLCGEAPAEIPGRLAPASSLMAVVMSRVATRSRYALYRTSGDSPIVPIVANTGLGESAPTLPAGPAYFQVPRRGRIDGIARAEEETRKPEDCAVGATYDYVGDPDSGLYWHPRVQPIPSLALLEGDSYSIQRRILPTGVFDAVEFRLRRDPFQLPPEITLSPEVLRPTAEHQTISFHAVKTGGFAYLQARFVPERDMESLSFSRSLDLHVFAPLPAGKSVTVAVRIVTDQATPTPHAAVISAADVADELARFWTVPSTHWRPFGIRFSVKSVEEMSYPGDLGAQVDFSVGSGGHYEVDDLWSALRPDGSTWRDDDASLTLFLVHAIRDDKGKDWGGVAPGRFAGYFVVPEKSQPFFTGQLNAHELGHKLGIDGDYEEPDRGDELMSHGEGIDGRGVRPKISLQDGSTASGTASRIAK